jgi:soluble lytic murein transglycosylase-like protein
MNKRTTRKRSNSLLLQSFSRSQLTKFFIGSIQKRIREKRKKGERLTSVEAHLVRKLRRLERRVFAPSWFKVLLELGRTLCQPLPVLLVLSLIVAAETSSRAYFLDEEPAPEHAIEELAAQELPSPEIQLAEAEVAELASPESQPEEELQEDSLADSLLAKAAASIEEAEANSAAKDLEKLNFEQQKYQGLIEFIAGVISVYCPSVQDPGQIAREIVQISHQEGIDPVFVASIIATESSFRTQARSRVGALGLMQLRPSTAREVLRKSESRHRALGPLTEPTMNIRLGISYYKELERRFRGSRALALSAYNWGPTNVDNAGWRFESFPGSVRNYSRKIEEKTRRWNQQYARASKTALEFQQTLAKTDSLAAQAG